jgi:uracil-DNA glycosylase family 4
MNKQRQLNVIKEEIHILKNSPLYSYRIKNNYIPVCGEGNNDTKIIFVGEAPGKKEAETGKPFCGASGKILDQLLSSISLKRKDIYITNILKDRPQNNRDPKPNEIKLYAPFLKKEIEIIQPKIIATLGRFSMHYIMNEFGLTNKIEIISKIHGKVFKIKTSWGDIKIIPLYHPAVAVYNKNKLPEIKKDFKVLK